MRNMVSNMAGVTWQTPGLTVSSMLQSEWLCVGLGQSGDRK